jgi:predicted Zn finger-like uncharacterized protein
MRLICPNCDAQYEVAEGAIPEAGRDVQCSACGHTWFQQHASAQSSAPATPVMAAPERPPEHAPEPPNARFDPPLPEDVPEVAADEAPPPAPEAPAHPAAASRSLDESVMAVLREEAEREARARESERPSLEVQEEFPLSAPAAPPAAAAAVRRIVVRSPEPEPDEVEAAEEATERPGKGRDLLPDIEEINSTLSPAHDPSHGAAYATAEPRRSGGFRRGFMFALLLGMLALAAYVTAPRIVQRFPAAEPTMTAYVRQVDVLRLKLDALMQRAIAAIQG